MNEDQNRKFYLIFIVRWSKQWGPLLLPNSGYLFPRLALMHEKHRAKEFKRRCNGLGIHGLTLHSYRYAWAERAKICGYPERFAQEALGHNSKAVHRAYARKAQVQLPALEDYEKLHEQRNIIPFDMQRGKLNRTTGNGQDGKPVEASVF